MQILLSIYNNNSDKCSMILSKDTARTPQGQPNNIFLDLLSIFQWGKIIGSTWNGLHKWIILLCSPITKLLLLTWRPIWQLTDTLFIEHLLTIYQKCNLHNFAKQQITDHVSIVSNNLLSEHIPQPIWAEVLFELYMERNILTDCARKGLPGEAR